MIDAKGLADVQARPAPKAIDVDQAGVRGLSLPIVVRDREWGEQHTVATVDLSADLPAAFKGTHMSRFVEAVESWDAKLDYAGLRTLLADVLNRLSARKAYAVIRFPYFLVRKAPASGAQSRLAVRVELVGELSAEAPDKPRFTLTVTTPVMTVCPCSLELCQTAAHSQRAAIAVACRSRGLVWIEELVEIAEKSGGSPVYSLLKREDEKAVTEAAFANPTFVEDAARHAADYLSAHPKIRWFRVSVESFESIHDHAAFAVIERDLSR